MLHSQIRHYSSRPMIIKAKSLLKKDKDSYTRYLKGMDASMRQKVALTAAHLRGSGTLVDMGMGSGFGSYALAQLYPLITIIGVDLEREMVERAVASYGGEGLRNLAFKQGDIAKKNFEDESVDFILDSSVLHHVTSYVGYRYKNAEECIGVQIDQLRVNGTLIVRDFLAPGGSEDVEQCDKGRLVYIDLPWDDGVEGDDPKDCSTSALLELFSKQFRILLSDDAEYPKKGFSLKKIGRVPVPETATEKTRHYQWMRYELNHRHAVEFVLRKDYRDDWNCEVQEEYCYFTQKEFEQILLKNSMRIMSSTPISNPWIEKNRFQGFFEMRFADNNEQIDHPATNYIIVGQKMNSEKGIFFKSTPMAKEKMNYLSLSHYKHKVTNEVFDIVSNPGRVLDLVPWFVSSGKTYVLARQGKARPILSLWRTESHLMKSLNGYYPSEYITEPMICLQNSEKLGLTVEKALDQYSIHSNNILSLYSGKIYFPSPGGINEEVRPVLIELSAGDEDKWFHSDLSEKGIRAIEIQELLRASHIGGLPDVRIELNAYRLCLLLGRSVGLWIGETTEILMNEKLDEYFRETSIEHLLLNYSRLTRAFTPVDHSQSTKFITLEKSTFREYNASNNQTMEISLEYALPVMLSLNTISTALLLRDPETQKILIGIEEDALPVAQLCTGNSNLLVTPSWRLPNSISNMTITKKWIQDQIMNDYGLTISSMNPLGGCYHPSPSTTPEVVMPHIISINPNEAVDNSQSRRKLHWVSLESCAKNHQYFTSAHLQIVILRCAHMFNLID